MDRGHREYLERRHYAREWHGRDSPNRRVISDFHFSGSELTGWTLLRTRRDARHTPPTLLTLWHRGDRRSSYSPLMSGSVSRQSPRTISCWRSWGVSNPTQSSVTRRVPGSVTSPSPSATLSRCSVASISW
jgi:hypothetical protein